MVQKLRVFSVAALATLVVAPASAADLFFCWEGANHYTMTGYMHVPDHLMSKTVITEDDVDAFKITGYAKSEMLGSWSLSDSKAGDTWHLRFDPATLTFLTGERFSSLASQGWNANGQVTNCGTPGFGFNSGNFAQDLCVNGQYVAASSVPPTTPLVAGYHPTAPNCTAQNFMSKRP